MGLDNFGSSGSDDSDSSSGSDSSKSSSSSGLSAFSSSKGGGGGGGGGGYSDRWQTRLDFGAPYVLVAQDRQGNIYRHRDHLAILEENTDWRRLDDHPDKEFEVLYRVDSKAHWLRFCNRAQEQLGVDPEELLQEDPEELHYVRQKVHFPPASKPDQSRDCRVCGANSDSTEVAMMEIDLQKHRKVPVCSSHTIEDLACEGLLS